jgi:hypothetical protein
MKKSSKRVNINPQQNDNPYLPTKWAAAHDPRMKHVIKEENNISN